MFNSPVKYECESCIKQVRSAANRDWMVVKNYRKNPILQAKTLQEKSYISKLHLVYWNHLLRKEDQCWPIEIGQMSEILFNKLNIARKQHLEFIRNCYISCKIHSAWPTILGKRDPGYEVIKHSLTWSPE